MRLLVLVGLLVVGCAMQARQERRERLAWERADFERNCMTHVERTPAQLQWCMMRQYDLARAEDAERDDRRERQHASQRAVDQMNTTNKLNAIQTQQDYNTVMGK